MNAAAAATFDFQSNGAITTAGRNTTATQDFNGISPPDGSLVSAGQKVTFELWMQDMDQRRVTGAAAWTDFGTLPNWPGNYSIKLTLTNATFTDTGLTTRTANADARAGGGVKNPAYFALYNVPITIASPWAGDVTITIEVTDNVTIPGTIALGPGGAVTDCQDAKTTVTITWKKATVFPKTETPDKQDPGKLGEIQTTDNLIVWYLYGPDLNGKHTNYQGITVDERFTAQTSNLQTAWVSAANQAAHPTWKDADWVKFFFSSSGANLTFMIGPDDHTCDHHSGRIFGGSVTDLSDAGKKATIYVDLPQTHEVPPGTTVGTYTIRRQRTGAGDGTGTYQIRKWTP